MGGFKLGDLHCLIFIGNWWSTMRLAAWNVGRSQQSFFVDSIFLEDCCNMLQLLNALTAICGRTRRYDRSGMIWRYICIYLRYEQRSSVSGNNIPPSKVVYRTNHCGYHFGNKRQCPAQGQLQAEQQKSVELSVSLGEAGPAESNRNGQRWMGKMKENDGKPFDVGAITLLADKANGTLAFWVEMVSINRARYGKPLKFCPLRHRDMIYIPINSDILVYLVWPSKDAETYLF